jgi:hypothetical protein
LTWAIPATVGTLVCDAMASSPLRPNLGRLAAWAVALMGLGYLFSCGTRFYDVPPDLVESLRGQKLAEHPVWPPREAIDAKLQEGKLSALLAEPPFVPPPGEDKHKTDVRKGNYWMMSQRSGTVSYLTFSAGFSLAVFILFFIICDRFGLELAFFRTFGTNALLAYIVHEMVDNAVKPFIPKDAPWWFVTAGLLLFFAITWVFVRHFEKRGVYLRV